ncbi:hypothetical protein B0A49_13257 [Cryomyces minteri]|uniref:HAT C-terminal dimerisation domain-containing protein n=1 Tax=Cryomyces minteri TaxID=331657 RepID=A0A4U0W9V4_9PEZI|nr:hypothetical protein B0A49_13257 [Cryomyces minteri]
MNASTSTPESNLADDYKDIDWSRLPTFQRPYKPLQRNGSWVWQFGYRMQERSSNVSTSSAIKHLAREDIPMHSVDRNGPITPTTKKRKRSVYEQVQDEHYIPQAVLNGLIASYNSNRFKRKILKWITARNQPLREVETSEFLEMIEAANPNAAEDIFKSHQSVHDYSLSEYSSHEGILVEQLKQAASKIHISFDGWSTRSGRHALTGVCVHYLDDQGVMRDFLLALPEQLGQHSGFNYAEVVGSVIARYDISKKLGFFVTDNASNKDTCLEYLADEFGFDKCQRRLRCTAHIVNLVAQSVLFGKDKESFENADENIPEEEQFLAEWRKEGPPGTLIDILNCIDTPQKHQLFYSYQHEENALLPTPDSKTLDVIKPYYIEKLNRERAACRAKGKRPPALPLFVEVGGLSSYDWDVVANYVTILQPLREAAKRLEARGATGRYGAIWEVIPTMNWLLQVFEEAKERVAEATTENYPNQEALEDHYSTNVNHGWKKLRKYFEKLDDTPAYYAAVTLHPHLKRVCINAWKDRPDWIINSDATFQKLWQTYKGRSVTPPQLSITKRVRPHSDLSKYMLSLTGTEPQSGNGAPEEAEDEYERWKAMKPLLYEHPSSSDPIGYWRMQRTEFPQLSQLAIDVLTIPASSADCERAFMPSQLEP